MLAQRDQFGGAEGTDALLSKEEDGAGATARSTRRGATAAQPVVKKSGHYTQEVDARSWLLPEGGLHNRQESKRKGGEGAPWTQQGETRA